jgi:hypothetical protein
MFSRVLVRNAKKVTVSLIYWQPKPTTHRVRSVGFVLPVGKSTYPIFCCCWASAHDPLLQVPALVHHNGAPSRLAGRASAAAIPAVRPRAVRRPRLCRGRPPAATRADERGTCPASPAARFGERGARMAAAVRRPPPRRVPRFGSPAVALEGDPGPDAPTKPRPRGRRPTAAASRRAPRRRWRSGWAPVVLPSWAVARECASCAELAVLLRGVRSADTPPPPSPALSPLPPPPAPTALPLPPVLSPSSAPPPPSPPHPATTARPLPPVRSHSSAPPPPPTHPAATAARRQRNSFTTSTSRRCETARRDAS